MQTEIDHGHPAWKSHGALEQKILKASAAAADALAENTNNRIVAIRLADDAEVRTLNRDFRNKDKATNVLSFEADLPETGWPEDEPRPLGDIVLAYETVLNEAERDKRSFDDHVSHLVVHGVLHLAGYDHEEAGAAEEMEALEVEILAGLGIANPYD